MSKEITTHEEFLESRRAKDFKGDYSPEETAWHNKQTAIHAVTLTHAYQSQIRQGFPPNVAFEKAVNNWKNHKK